MDWGSSNDDFSRPPRGEADVTLFDDDPLHIEHTYHWQVLPVREHAAFEGADHLTHSERYCA